MKSLRSIATCSPIVALALFCSGCETSDVNSGSIEKAAHEINELESFNSFQTAKRLIWQEAEAFMIERSDDIYFSDFVSATSDIRNSLIKYGSELIDELSSDQITFASLSTTEIRYALTLAEEEYLEQFPLPKRVNLRAPDCVDTWMACEQANLDRWGEDILDCATLNPNSTSDYVDCTSTATDNWLITSEICWDDYQACK